MYNHIRGGLLGIAAALAILSVLTVADEPPSPDSGQVHPFGDIRALGERLSNAPDGSVLAATLRSRIEELHRRPHDDDPGEENPGILIEAMAQLKRTRDGRTYAPNYKAAALRLARERSVAKTAAPLPWVERGPGNVSGRARAIVVDASDPSHNTWWVASIGGGIWKTSNAGTSWENKTPDLATLATSTIVQTRSNPDVFYVGTGMGYGRVVDLEGSGIWKSTDHGDSWFQLQSTANGELLEAVNRLVVDPNDENVVLACTNDSFSHLGVEEGPRKSGIFRTADGGTTWTQVFDPESMFGSATDNRVQQIIADPTNFNNLYATVNEVGVVKSTNGGISWQVSADNFALPSDVGNPTGNGFDLAGISVRTEIAIAPTDPNRIYAAVERPRGIADLYVSNNAGASWSLVPDTGNDPNWFNSFGASGANGAYTAGWFDNTIAVHPYNENVVYVGGVQLYRIDYNPTANTRRAVQIASGGSSNPNENLPYAHPDHHWLEMIADNPAAGSFRILNANDGGIAVSSDGGVNWLQYSNLVTTQFYGADKKPGESAYVGGTQDNGTWISGSNPGSNSVWRHVIGGDGFEAVWNYRDGNLVLGGSQGNRLSRSLDGGQNWLDVPGFPSSANRSPFITKLANSKVDPDLVFAVSMDGIVRTEDFGESWTITPILGNWLGWRPFDNVEVSNADPQIVWASSRMDVDPASGRRGGVHVSVDGGLSFREISNNLPPNLAEAAGIATHPIDRNTAYLLFAGPGEQKIMRTTDLGATWEDISGFDVASKSTISVSPTGFPDVAVFSLLVMPYDTDVLWAGTEIGLFESTDGGDSWSLAGNGFPNVAIFELSIVDDQILAATQGRGVWSVDLPELNGYRPPSATLAPRLTRLSLIPDGFAAIGVDMRSPYDSTIVVLDGDVFARLPANEEPRDTLLFYTVTESRTIAVSVTSYRDGRSLRTGTRLVNVFAADPVTTYVTDLEAAGSILDFVGTGFTVRQPNGFFNRAIHTSHPYANGVDAIYQLKVPIEVAKGNANFSYDDIALIEEGVTGDYKDPLFFDYVIVEGSTDGQNWLPLLPGYDARANPQWLQAYRAGVPQGGADSQASGSPSMFVRHEINLLDTFNRGDKIFIRFRLHADGLARGWGWAIDNIEIQPNAIVSNEIAAELPDAFHLGQNYPNPFSGTSTIPFGLNESSRVSLAVYDISGRHIAYLLKNQIRQAGAHTVQVDGGMLASGTYFYELAVGPLNSSTGGRVESKSLTIVR